MKSTHNLDDLRRDEKLKILCGKAHFANCLGQNFAFPFLSPFMLFGVDE